MNNSQAFNKSLFREEVEEYQKGQKRTKSEMAKNSAIWIGASAFLLISTIIILYIFKDDTPAVFWLIIPISAGGFFYGIYGLIRSVLRTTKVVACPGCGVNHEIFKKEHNFICTECGTLLTLGRDPESPIEFVLCWYCNNQQAVSHDIGEFQCMNCGVTLSSSGAQVDGDSKICPDCQAEVPHDAFYCIHCEHLLRPLPKYDMDWKAGKDAAGHYYFARMLMATFPNKISELEDRIKNYKFYSGRFPWSEFLDELRDLLESLAEALRSMEEALKEPELVKSIQGLLPEVDFFYARLLILELRTFVWAEGPEKATIKVRSYGPYDDVWNKGPQIQARKRIERIIGRNSLQSSGSIGYWDDALVAFLSEKDTTDPTKPTVYELVGYEGLKTEAKRFAEWARQCEISNELWGDFLKIEEQITLRDEDKKETQVKSSIPERTRTIEQVRDLPGSDIDSAEERVPVAAIKNGEKAQRPRKATGWVLLIMGLVFFCVGIGILAPIIMQFTSSEDFTYTFVQVVAGLLLCPAPFLVGGLGLVVVGIINIRRTRKNQQNNG